MLVVNTESRMPRCLDIFNLHNGSLSFFKCMRGRKSDSHTANTTTSQLLLASKRRFLRPLTWLWHKKFGDLPDQRRYIRWFLKLSIPSMNDFISNASACYQQSKIYSNNSAARRVPPWSWPKSYRSRSKSGDCVPNFELKNSNENIQKYNYCTVIHTYVPKERSLFYVEWKILCPHHNNPNRWILHCSDGHLLYGRGKDFLCYGWDTTAMAGYLAVILNIQS